jgi:hypothetical protein
VIGYLPLIFGIIIAITYYQTNRLNLKLNAKKKHHSMKLLSAASGVSITYVLLELFPTFIKTAGLINRLIFIAIPLGFITHHLIEKEIYQHTKKHDLLKLISTEEDVFSYFYHVILGIILVLFARENLISGILAFIPLLTFTIVSTLPMDPHPTKSKTVVMSTSTVLGVILALILKIPLWVELSLVGLGTGILLYTVIRHHIPFGSKGRIGYFTFGFIFYTLLIVTTWYV